MVPQDEIKADDTGLAEDVFKAAKEAGRQLVKEGRISEETQKAVATIFSRIYPARLNLKPDG